MSRILRPSEVIMDNVVDLGVRKRIEQYKRVLDAVDRIDKELDKLERLKNTLERQEWELKEQLRLLEKAIERDRTRSANTLHSEAKDGP